ncbi:MAG TPA: class I SAM-dependent methyltransferase, partial [bacterium]
GRTAKIFNLGCGPAKEVQEFLSGYDICEKADFTLLDFNDETLSYTQRELESLKVRHRRRTPIQLVKRSVNQILKETFKTSMDGPLAQKYDLVYCAGLFDYLSDRICQRLIDIFYEMLVPGGMLVATNVSSSNPARQLMEYFMEWHLVYRNVDQVKSMAPKSACPDLVRVQSDSTGVNLFLEVRKPENG